MTFDQWAQTVDLLCRTHLACSWADLCGDIDPLKAGFDAGQTPQDFVRWFVEKYDLDWLDDLQIGGRHRGHGVVSLEPEQ